MDRCLAIKQRRTRVWLLRNYGLKNTVGPHPSQRLQSPPFCKPVAEFYIWGVGARPHDMDTRHWNERPALREVCPAVPFGSAACGFGPDAVSHRIRPPNWPLGNRKVRDMPGPRQAGAEQRHPQPVEQA